MTVEHLLWTRAMIILALSLDLPTKKVTDDFVHGITPDRYRANPDYPL